MNRSGGADRPAPTDAAEEAPWADVAAAEEIAEGAPFGARVDGRAVVLVRAGGVLHALEGVCTHASVLLEEGWLDGGAIVCPMHEAAFCLRTGAALQPPACRALDVYDVREEEGRLLVARRPRPRGAS
jgi:3-phenylpropionate/trans-cinnamate dioxygenase ferredoxin subunit